MEITDLKAFPIEIELKDISEGHGLSPYLTGTPGRKDRTYKTIYKILTSDGTVGWGETSNIMSEKITKTIVEEYFKPRMVGKSVFDINNQRDSFPDMLHNIKLDVFYSGIEMAALDAAGKLLDMPVYELLGGKYRDNVGFAYLYGMASIEDTVERAQQAKEEGFESFKTKIGGYRLTDHDDALGFERSLNYDIERIVSIDEACTNLPIRIDANQTLNKTETLRITSELESRGVSLEYIEQPLPLGSIETNRHISSRMQTPLAINEDSYFDFNLTNFISAEATDVAVLDLVPLGGIRRTKALAEQAASQNISIAHHSCFDLGIKTAAILHLVSSTPAFDLATDSVYYAFEDDVISDRFTFEDGGIEVSDDPGLGIEVDQEKIERYQTYS